MKHYKDTNNKLYGFEDTDTQEVIDSIAITNGWTLMSLTEEEYQTLIAPTPEQIAEQQIQDITSAIQMMLDTKAQSMRYDNMMSARSYAGYVNPFQDEAQSLAIWSANCWEKAGQIEADVRAGTRAIPTADEVLAEMPTL